MQHHVEPNYPHHFSQMLKVFGFLATAFGILVFTFFATRTPLEYKSKAATNPFPFPEHDMGEIDCTLDPVNCPVRAIFNEPPFELAKSEESFTCSDGRPKYVIPLDICFTENPGGRWNQHGQATVEGVVNGERQVLAASVWQVDDPRHYVCGRPNSRFKSINLIGCLSPSSCPDIAVNIRFRRDSILPDGLNLKKIGGNEFPACPNSSPTPTLTPTPTLKPTPTIQIDEPEGCNSLQKYSTPGYNNLSICQELCGSNAQGLICTPHTPGCTSGTCRPGRSNNKGPNGFAVNTGNWYCCVGASCGQSCVRPDDCTSGLVCASKKNMLTNICQDQPNCEQSGICQCGVVPPFRCSNIGPGCNGSGCSQCYADDQCTVPDQQNGVFCAD